MAACSNVVVLLSALFVVVNCRPLVTNEHMSAVPTSLRQARFLDPDALMTRERRSADRSTDDEQVMVSRRIEAFISSY